MDFGCQHGAKLAPKWDQKSMLTSKGDFSKNFIFLKEKPFIFTSRGSTNQEQIEEKSIKNEAKMRITLNIDFHGFSSILGGKLEPSWHQKSIKNRSKKASKT